ncbi:MAG: SRPBCC family protein [Acidimicrobiia bacterium]|nr:SRPBCC family protein [Acidimicrobiia bacterium]
MITFIETIEVPLPVGDVFERLADMAELHRWNPSVTASRRTGGERFGVGSTYESTLRRGPIRVNVCSTLTGVEPGRSVTYEGSIAGFWSIDTLEFSPSGTGSLVTFRNESRPPAWMRIFSPLVNAAFQPQARRAVEGARRYLDQSID